MTTISKTELSTARARAGRIRQGIHGYLETLAEISQAYAERDWLSLGYADWQSYVDEEFGADRLRLPPEHRQKAVTELRLAGMSQRAIGTVLGVSQKTVDRDLDSGESNDSPERVTGADGKTYAAAREPEPPAEPSPDPSPLTEAIAAAIEGTVERAETRGSGWSEQEEDLRERMEDGFAVVVSLRGSHANLIRWAEQNNRYVRIDRRTDWGNPFEMPADGDRTAVIQSYALHYLPHKPSLLGRLEDLRGKALGCWCAPEACHGDVLLEVLESPC
jgi:hypothetical protein